MADIALYVRFDGEDKVRFVAGEDREIQMAFGDTKTGLPISLEGYQLSFHLPRAGIAGGAIKRRLAPATVSYLGAARAAVGVTLFSLQSHGLVSGETVRAQVMGQAGLPAPLLPDTDYTVSATDNDLFGLMNADGTPVVITETLPMDFYLSQVGTLVVDDVNLGLASVKLPMAVTEAVSPGRGQPLQVVLRDASGLTRVFLQTYGLDVFEQVLA